MLTQVLTKQVAMYCELCSTLGGDVEPHSTSRLDGSEVRIPVIDCSTAASVPNKPDQLLCDKRNSVLGAHSCGKGVDTEILQLTDNVAYVCG